MTDGPNLYANYFLLSLLDPNGMRCLNCCCCPKDLFARERYSESKVVPPGDENNPFGKYYLSMAFEVIAHVEFNLNNITFDQDRGCTIKWYECGTRDSSIGGKANEWNVIPDNLAERLRGGLDGDPPVGQTQFLNVVHLQSIATLMLRPYCCRREQLQISNLLSEYPLPTTVTVSH